MAKPENPPAFPTDGRIQHGTPYDGMSLRDWFAGQVAAATAWPTCELYAGELPHEAVAAQIAVQSYQIADAMLAARENTDG